MCEEFFFFLNAIDTNYFTKYFTNFLCGEWLLVYKKNDVSGKSRWDSVKIYHTNNL